MNIPFKFRAQLEGMSQGGWIARTVQDIITAISAAWQVQHTDDGAHTTITLGSLTGPSISYGIGSPEGVKTAPMGSLYLRTDGAAATTLYVKTSGSAATGWTAK